MINQKWSQEHPGYMATYKRDWAKRHPSYQRDLIERRKLEAIVAAGGQCLDCGYDDLDHPEVFDFDHRDPTEKHPRLIGTRLSVNQLPELLREAEQAKCDLVCSNCHRIRTKRQARNK
jgi:hypothetical protein